jgi:hypothetical protein
MQVYEWWMCLGWASLLPYYETGWEWKSGTKGCIYKIPFNQNSDINYVMFLIKQKYKLLTK